MIAISVQYIDNFPNDLGFIENFSINLDLFCVCCSKEEVEKCKQKDLLEEMLREMTGEFPALSQVFVKERDMFLANSLKMAAKPIPNPNLEAGLICSWLTHLKWPPNPSPIAT